MRWRTRSCGGALVDEAQARRDSTELNGRVHVRFNSNAAPSENAKPSDNGVRRASVSVNFRKASVDAGTSSRGSVSFMLDGPVSLGTGFQRRSSRASVSLRFAAPSSDACTGSGGVNSRASVSNSEGASRRFTLATQASVICLPPSESEGSQRNLSEMQRRSRADSTLKERDSHLYNSLVVAAALEQTRDHRADSALEGVHEDGDEEEEDNDTDFGDEGEDEKPQCTQSNSFTRRHRRNRRIVRRLQAQQKEEEAQDTSPRQRVPSKWRRVRKLLEVCEVRPKICETLPLGLRRASAEVPLMLGDKVVVQVAFSSNSANSVPLQRGERGVVKQFNAVNGSVLIHFKEHFTSQWIWASNLCKLNVPKRGPAHVPAVLPSAASVAAGTKGAHTDFAASSAANDGGDGVILVPRRSHAPHVPVKLPSLLTPVLVTSPRTSPRCFAHACARGCSGCARCGSSSSMSPADSASDLHTFSPQFDWGSISARSASISPQQGASALYRSPPPRQASPRVSPIGAFSGPGVVLAPPMQSPRQCGRRTHQRLRVAPAQGRLPPIPLVPLMPHPSRSQPIQAVQPPRTPPAGEAARRDAQKKATDLALHVAASAVRSLSERCLRSLDGSLAERSGFKMLDGI